ncbi:MAG: hypothetical protein CM15mP74_32070 [Halieaceae bacterium]|nr:MAG: hypothetical protein CM15mP74_32070 [Halieaceae bacterium]
MNPSKTRIWWLANNRFHHVPMAEDWPVMPAKVDEIVLKPRNFFDLQSGNRSPQLIPRRPTRESLELEGS